jgi:hypothetical protein
VINISGAHDSFGQGINNLDEIVGLYADSALIKHGFFRNAAGTLTVPIDFPGSATSQLNGINDKHWRSPVATPTALAFATDFWLASEACRQIRAPANLGAVGLGRI